MFADEAAIFFVVNGSSVPLKRAFLPERCVAVDALERPLLQVHREVVA